MQNQVLRQFTIMLGVLVLFGFGCKGSAPVSSIQDAPSAPDARVSDAPAPDAGSKIPAGWNVYENNAQGVKIAYPGEWYYRQLPAEETGSTTTLVVMFNQEPIVPLPDSDPVYPLTLSVRVGTVADEIALARNAQAPQQAVINGRTFTKLLYTDEIMDLSFTSYMLEADGKVYSIDGLSSLPELENVVASFAVEVQP